MTYDTSGIQQEGRLFEVGQETRSQPNQHGQGSRRKEKGPEEKERDKLRKRELRAMRKEGALPPPKTKETDPYWLACSKCFASVGIGSLASSRLLAVHAVTISNG